MSESQLVKCGQCHFEFDHGVKVCQGCRGDVVYGASPKETSDAAKLGGAIGLFVGMLLMFGAPGKLNEWFGVEIAPAFGLGLWAWAFVLGGAIIGGVIGSGIAIAANDGKVRTYRY